MITDLLWIIPTFQSIHIVALATLFTSVGAIALRSYGVLAVEASPAQIAQRFAPWIWLSLVVLLITGTVLIIGEPPRELVNWAFWIKIPLIVIASIATAVTIKGLANSEGASSEAVIARARSGTAFIVVVWTLVVVFGRLVAYGQMV
jgi:hypothetical protein